MTILDRLDAAIGGLCPCGAEPADGSAYCSDDCRPTHHARDTGLAMVGEFRRGPFNAQVFEHPDRDELHLRLDDGHRYVGLDVTGEAAATDGLEPVWQRLERELTDPRHAVPGDPWADVWDAARRAFVVQCDAAAGMRAWPVPAPWAADLQRSLRDAIRGVGDAMRAAAAGRFASGGEVFRVQLHTSTPADHYVIFDEVHGWSTGRWCRQHQPEPHPMLAAIERRRRNANSGPERRQLPPRNIQPRRAR